MAQTTSTSGDAKDNTLAAPAGRRGSKAGFSSAATSIASSENLLDSASDVKLSGDSSLDPFKSRASDDGQSETSSHRRKMSRLFKKGKRGRRKSTQDDPAPPDTPQEPVPPMPEARPQQRTREESFQSEDSLGLAKSVPSSLLTEDSDTESSPVRPGISPHDSHTGYLTLSSPLINSETTVSSDLSKNTAETSLDGVGPPKHANTIAVSPAPSIKRTASPVGKLKDAFSPQRRSTSPKTAGSPSNSRPNTSGGTLGTLFGGKPRASRILEDTEPQASPPQIHDGQSTQSTSSLPASAPKRIVSLTPVTPPNLVDAPTTLVTPPTPTDAKPPSPTASTTSSKAGTRHTPSQSNPNIIVSPSGNMISHRRVRSATNPPSKLSNSTSALTPTLEEIKTPGGTAYAPPSSSGFFSSVFSAAQNAATSLTTSIANTTTINKNKSASQQKSTEEDKTGEAGGEEVIGPENADSSAAGTEKKRPAVETLGSGNLSLAQLGITDSEPSLDSSANTSKMGDEVSAQAEDFAAAQAISAAYAADEPETAAHERRRSLSASGPASPGRQPEVTDSPAASSVQRQGSIRSRISGGRRRRHRGSSVTTGQSTLAPPANGQRLNGTGFAVASPKRNRDFHNLFKSVPEDDYLIEDYSAALQKEILLQGRLYVSEGHLCFSSNILGWVTNLVISFDEVVSVEKKSTAMLFPNGMVIQTLHARNIFASFLSRDATYDLIVGIWKISHPNLKSSLNGVTLDGSAGTGDKTEKAESITDEGSIQDSDDEVYDEDAEEEEGMGSFTEAGEGSVAGSEMGSAEGPVDSKKASAAVAEALATSVGKPADGAEAAANGAPAEKDFPGPATHAPTDCGDKEQHYDKLLIDTTIPAPLGKVYSLMFGPASGVFMRKWLIEDQKSTDLQMEDDKKGLGEERKTFTFSYIKPLPGSIGPRQTRCNISMNLEQLDLEKAVTVLCSTQTPDVPSGNAFVTKTRYCLCWGPANSTRLIMSFTVEWSGKSWLKGPIEKGANDGQLTYANSITAALRAAVSSKALTKGAPGAKTRNGKKRGKTATPEDTASVAPIEPAPPAAQSKGSSWGIFEPLHSLLGSSALSGILLVLCIWSLFFRSPSSMSGSSVSQVPQNTAARIAAYEQIWRAEEAGLWRWMEERVALDRVHDAVAGGRRVRDARHMQEVLRDEDMVTRSVDEAIRVTEERLDVLKGVVERERERERQKGTGKSWNVHVKVRKNEKEGKEKGKA